MERIGDCWFYGCEARTVTIPASVREIGGLAFCNCRRLKNVIIAEGSRLWKLEDRCFRNCAVEEVTLPGTLTSMSFDAFQGCNSLRTVYVEDGCNINVRAYPLRNMSVLPAKETVVEGEMLWDLRGLKSVRLAEGLERLGSYWFCRS